MGWLYDTDRGDPPAIRHRATLYDATYLELDLRRSLLLATLDEQLQRAAKAESVRLLG